MRKTFVTILFGVLIIGSVTGVIAAYNPSLDIIHEYDDHSGSLVGVEYHSQFDTVFSLDENGTLIAYQVHAENTQEITKFEAGHALTTGDEVVFIAARDTLWEFNVTAGEMREVTKMEVHPQAIDYDEQRDIVWIGGDGTVYGYNAEDGSLQTTYSEHSKGIVDIHANGEYIASGAGFTSEVVVYDVEAEGVAFRPELPDDVTSISAVHVTDDDRLIVGTDAEDGSVVSAYDIADQQQQASYRKHIFGVSAIEYDEKHDVIISMGFDNTVKFFDVEANEVAAQYEHADTIYAGDIDTRNSALWIGDGEQREGTVTALDIFYEEPTPTPEPTPEPTEAPTVEQTATPEPSPESTTPGGNGPGFSVLLTILAAIGAIILFTREQ